METSFFQHKINRVLGTVGLVFVIIALASYANYANKQARYMYMGPTTVSFTGEGEVMVKPDVGNFSFSITETAKDATSAQNALKSKMDTIVAFLKEKGVAEKDIKTTGYNLYPKYEDVPVTSGSVRGEMAMIYPYPSTKQEQVGYEITESVNVKVRNLDTVGDLLSQVGDKGAQNVSGLDFVIDDEDKYKAEARKAAIANAKAKAEELAKELDVRLGEMVGFYEGEMGMPMPMYEGMGGDMMKSSVMAESANVQVGETSVTSRVTLTYQVKGGHGSR